MNDMEPKFSSAASVAIATYYLLIDQPSAALQILDDSNETETYGLYYLAHTLLRAKAYRQLNQLTQSIHILEKSCVSTAYRTQDKRLLFQVSEETGHVEYELGNHLGAIHEWGKSGIYRRNFNKF